MPAKRLTPPQAKVLMLILYPVAFSSSLTIGGWRQCVSLIVLGIWYNNHGGSSRYISRNFINACGFVCYASGAMEVALGVALPVTGSLIGWLLLIATVVFTTVQTQDLYDQAGDRACGRSTMPLAIGDWNCRLITVLAMLIWLWICPAYWKVSIRVAVIFTCMGFLIVVRLTLKRTVAEDKTTFKLWNAWILFLYTLPLIKYAELTLA
ncbi:hypothetical protein EAE96_007024 [Botrytis aclada]|nr:hypothetical protein EAE96_007024 [Botrytis aclada]